MYLLGQQSNFVQSSVYVRPIILCLELLDLLTISHLKPFCCSEVIHCPKNDTNVSIKIEPVIFTVDGVDAKYCIYMPGTKTRHIQYTYHTFASAPSAEIQITFGAVQEVIDNKSFKSYRLINIQEVIDPVSWKLLPLCHLKSISRRLLTFVSLKGECLGSFFDSVSLRGQYLESY